MKAGRVIGRYEMAKHIRLTIGDGPFTWERDVDSIDQEVTFQTDLYDALKIGLISMDSTLKSNLGVGPPIDVVAIRRDMLDFDVIPVSGRW